VAGDRTSVSVATQLDPDLLALLRRALGEMVKWRGGKEVVETIRRGRPDEQLAEELVGDGCVWVARDDNEALLGLALCRGGLIELLYVERAHRRQGVARSILSTLASSDNPPVDGLALPGDRATKSLYESIGWKARLLTMRGE
jgi:GNAT superfamily N-acetyltransferase